jgi:hypothetical protein
MAKYGKKSQEKVKEVMDEMKEGKLKSGRSGKKVTNRKQAIAIGLSEARKEGDKVPPPKNKGAKKAASKKSASKKSDSKKSASKKSVKKAAPKKGAKKTAKKSTAKKR